MTRISRWMGMIAGFCVAVHGQWCQGEAYVFAGLNVDNLIAFREDSVPDSSDLSQGPNRNGTGEQLDFDDFQSPSGGGFSSGVRVDFDDVRASSSGPSFCWGDCDGSDDDFTRPTLFPVDPTGDERFARGILDSSGNIFSFGDRPSSLATDTVAEIELNGALIDETSFSRTIRSYFRVITVDFADELVFDFDADLLLRAIGGPASAARYTQAQSSFRMTLSNSVDGTVFSFAPNGTGTGHMGANVVADPFDLNTIAGVRSPFSVADTEKANVGQFRAITPTLVPGRAYSLFIDQEVMVTVSSIPEPTTSILACLVATLLFSRVRR